MTNFDPFPDNECPQEFGMALEYLRLQRNISKPEMANLINRRCSTDSCQPEHIEEIESFTQCPDTLTETQTKRLHYFYRILENIRPIPEELRIRVSPAYFSIYRDNEPIKDVQQFAKNTIKPRKPVGRPADHVNFGSRYSSFCTPITPEIRKQAAIIKDCLTNEQGEVFITPNSINGHPIKEILKDFTDPSEYISTTSCTDILYQFAEMIRNKLLKNHVPATVIEKFTNATCEMIRLIDVARETSHVKNIRENRKNGDIKIE